MAVEGQREGGRRQRVRASIKTIREAGLRWKLEWMKSRRRDEDGDRGVK